eukprot:751357-Prymnesium_polylepis.1
MQLPGRKIVSQLRWTTRSTLVHWVKYSGSETEYVVSNVRMIWKKATPICKHTIQTALASGNTHQLFSHCSCSPSTSVATQELES